MREIKQNNERVLSDAQLFAAMPPLEQLKCQCSLLVSKKWSKRGRKLKMRLLDISRAHFYGLAERDVYVSLPEEEHEDARGFGRGGP